MKNLINILSTIETFTNIKEEIKSLLEKSILDKSQLNSLFKKEIQLAMQKLSHKEISKKYALFAYNLELLYKLDKLSENQIEKNCIDRRILKKAKYNIVKIIFETLQSQEDKNIFSVLQTDEEILLESFSTQIKNIKVNI